VANGPDHVCRVVAGELLKELRLTPKEGAPLVQSDLGNRMWAATEILDDVFQSGEPYLALEVPVYSHPIGERRDIPDAYVNMIVRPLTDIHGEVEGVLAYGIDVTVAAELRRRLPYVPVDEWKTASQEAARVGKLLEVLVSTHNAGIVVVTVDGRVLYVNGAALYLLGHSSQEALAAEPSDLLLNLLGVERFGTINERRAGDAYIASRLHARVLASGEERWTLDTIIDACNQDETPEILVVHMQDITERRRSQDRSEAGTAVITQYILTYEDLDVLFEKICSLVARTLDVPLVRIMVVDSSGTLRIRTARGWQVVGEENLAVSTEIGTYARAVLDATRASVVSDVANEQRFVFDPMLESMLVVSTCGVAIPGPGAPLGILDVHATSPRVFSSDDLHFLQDTATGLGLAIERLRVWDALREIEYDLRTEARDVENAMRFRMARDLHDETAQVLNVLNAELHDLALQVREHRPEWAQKVARMLTLTERIIASTRAVSENVYPDIIARFGLLAAIQEHIARLTEIASLHVTLQCPEALPDLPLDVATALYKIIQESLNNVAKHSTANEASVTLHVENGRIALEVRDPGDPVDSPDQIGHHYGGTGLAGMRWRAESLGGSFEAVSRAGDGTRVFASIPFHTAGQPASRVIPSRAQRLGDKAKTATRVLVVDDHAVTRAGLRAILETQRDLDVVGEAEDGQEALALIPQLQPDVVTMDIVMPRLNGLETARQISARFPTVRTIAVSMHEDREHILQALRAGVKGYVVKRASEHEIATAVRAVAADDSYFSPSVANVLREHVQQFHPTDSSSTLTEREREILHMMVQGKTSREIAEYLVISIHTVKVHRVRIRKKLGVTDQASLVRAAMQLGIVPPDE
jgi:PAS domain S-box-containing protein